NGAERGVVVRLGRRVGRLQRVETPGQGEVAGGAVVEVVVADAAGDGVQVGQAGEARQVFADLEAGDRRGDGSEGAADLFRGVGLGVPGVELTLAAAGEDDED